MKDIVMHETVQNLYPKMNEQIIDLIHRQGHVQLSALCHDEAFRAGHQLNFRPLRTGLLRGFLIGVRGYDQDGLVVRRDEIVKRFRFFDFDKRERVNISGRHLAYLNSTQKQPPQRWPDPLSTAEGWQSWWLPIADDRTLEGTIYLDVVNAECLLQIEFDPDWVASGRIQVVQEHYVNLPRDKRQGIPLLPPHSLCYFRPLTDETNA